MPISQPHPYYSFFIIHYSFFIELHCTKLKSKSILCSLI